jgi:hypothetical protein
MHPIISSISSIDGQFCRGQDYFRECCDQADESNVVLSTIKFLRVLYEDVPSVDSYIDPSVLAVLDVSAQVFNTLNDMLQVRNFDHYI